MFGYKYTFMKIILTCQDVNEYVHVPHKKFELSDSKWMKVW